MSFFILVHLCRQEVAIERHRKEEMPRIASIGCEVILVVPGLVVRRGQFSL
jgi:hypothetical protein